MDLFKEQMVDAMNKMSFVLKPTLGYQLNYIRLQIQEELYSKITNKFKDGYDKIENNLEEQISLMADLYQFYGFIQSNSIDALVNVNNRVEYETLWRFPIKDELTKAVGERDSLMQNGKFQIFSDFEIIRKNMEEEYHRFKNENPNSKAEENTISIAIDNLEEFWLNGNIILNVNPIDQGQDYRI